MIYGEEELNCEIWRLKDKINNENFLEEHIDFFIDYKEESAEWTLESAILEYSDGKVDIYTDDLFDWAKNHIEEVDRALEEYDAKDICKAISFAQSLVVRDNLFDNIENILRYVALSKALSIVEKNNLAGITEEQYEAIEEYVQTLDCGSRICEIFDFVEKTCQEATQKQTRKAK